MRKILNHKWQCSCGAWIGEDILECPLCKIKDKSRFNQEVQREKVKEKISQLKNGQARQILKMRYGLNQYKKQWTYEEIGERLSLSRQRIHQIAIYALQKIRAFE